MKTHSLPFVIAALAVLPAVRASAQPYYAAPPPSPPPAPEVVTSKHVGVGYKIGNGLGFVGGDLIIAPIDRVAINLQANWFSVSAGGDTANGYGLAPGVQFRFKDGPGSSPYLGLGFLHLKISLNGTTASAQGGFFNAGYEWRFPGGFGILLGGGMSYLGEVRVSDGASTVTKKGGPFPNLEFGLRYLFL